MVKKAKKEQKDNKYSTIIVLKDNVKKISEARDAWKIEKRNYGEIGLSPFIMFLLEFYETNKDKK